jgi:hypothetical protein
VSSLLRFAHENWPTALVIVALVIGYLFLRTNPTPLASFDEFSASLQQGKPTVVEFYANT